MSLDEKVGVGGRIHEGTLTRTDTKSQARQPGFACCCELIVTSGVKVVYPHAYKGREGGEPSCIQRA